MDDEVSRLGRCIENEFASFLASFEQSEEDTSTVLIFPSDVGPVLRKCIQDQAVLHNLATVFIQGDKLRAIAVCQKHHISADPENIFDPDEPINIRDLKDWISDQLICKQIEELEDAMSLEPDSTLENIEEESEANQALKSFHDLERAQASSRDNLYTQRYMVSETFTTDETIGSDTSVDSLEVRMLLSFSDKEDSSGSEDNFNVIINSPETPFQKGKSDKIISEKYSSSDTVQLDVSDKNFHQHTSSVDNQQKGINDEKSSANTVASNSASELNMEAELLVPQSKLNVNAVEFIPYNILQKETTDLGEPNSFAQQQYSPRYYDSTQAQSQLGYVSPYEIAGPNGGLYLSSCSSPYYFKQQYYDERNLQLNDPAFSHRYKLDFSVDEVEHFRDNSTFVITSEVQYNPYQSSKEMDFMIELYNIPRNYTTNDLLCIYKEEPRYIKWCDYHHALLITGSSENANRALSVRHPIIKSRAMINASPRAIMTVNNCQLTPAAMRRTPSQRNPNKSTANLQHTSQGDEKSGKLDATTLVPPSVKNENNKTCAASSTEEKQMDTSASSHSDQSETHSADKNKIINCVLNKPITDDNIATLSEWHTLCKERKLLIEQVIGIFKGDVTVVVATEKFDQFQNEMNSEMKEMKTENNKIQGNKNNTGRIQHILNIPPNEFGETTPVDASNMFPEASAAIELISKYFKEPKTVVIANENYKPYQEILLKNMEHIIELYDIPSTHKLEDILSVYEEEPCYVKWCNDNHALLVTGSPQQAERALSINDSVIKSRSMIMASPVATAVACTYTLTPAVRNEKQLEDDDIQQQLKEVVSKQAQELVDEVIEQAKDIALLESDLLWEVGQGDIENKWVQPNTVVSADDAAKNANINQQIDITGDYKQDINDILQQLKEVVSKQAQEFVDEVIEQAEDIALLKSDLRWEVGQGDMENKWVQPYTVVTADDAAKNANINQQIDIAGDYKQDIIIWEAGTSYGEWY